MIRGLIGERTRRSRAPTIREDAAKPRPYPRQLGWHAVPTLPRAQAAKPRPYLREQGSRGDRGQRDMGMGDGGTANGRDAVAPLP